MTVIHDPGNEEGIDILYAWLSIDEYGYNGIVAHILPNLGATPLVTGKLSLAERMKPLAERVAKESGKHVGLFAFDRRGDTPIWEVEP